MDIALRAPPKLPSSRSSLHYLIVSSYFRYTPTSHTETHTSRRKRVADQPFRFRSPSYQVSLPSFIRQQCTEGWLHFVTTGMPFDDFKGHTLRTDWRGILDGLQSRNRLVWTVSAILSLLTSRYLLVELNVHYPLHLHLIHLATAGIIAAISYFRSRQEPSTYTNEQLTASGWARLGLLAASMAISMILIVQAVLHFQNFPSLVILTVSIIVIVIVIALT